MKNNLMRRFVALILHALLTLFLVACGSGGSGGGGGSDSGNNNGGSNESTADTISCPSSASLSNAWTKRTSGTANNLNGIVYAKNIFIAVGTSGTILSSPDGATWTQKTSGTTNNLNGVTYQNNVFIVSGDNGTLLTSADGESWQIKTVNTQQPLYDIIYANNFYLLGGWDYIAKSTDFSSWTQWNDPGSSGAYSIAYGNNLFAFGGEDGSIYSSSDGLNWTNRQTGDCYIAKIIYVNNKFYAVGGDCISGSRGAGYVSTDGMAWSKISDLNTSDISYYDIASCGSSLVVTGNNGNLKISGDGTTWTSGTTGDANSINGAAFGNNTIVIAGDNGAILQLQ